MIAVTGATGFVGRRTAERLDRPRLVVRDRSRAQGDVRQASSYGAHDEMRAALEGVHTLFLVPAEESEDRVRQHTTAVDAAVAAGVERIVYLSFINAAPDSTFTLARDHWATEEHIRAAGPAFTFLRMSLYLDFVPRMASNGVIAGPAGEGRVAAVARDDVAAVAAAVLNSGGHDSETYDVTGGEALTLGEIAAQLGATYKDETLEEAWASRASYGAPEWQVEAWISTYTAIAAGELATVSDTVRRFTGREPLTLAQL